MNLLVCALPLLLVRQAHSFNMISIQHEPTVNPTKRVLVPREKIHSYEEAFRIIDDCAASEGASDSVYDAVRFLERNSYCLYRDPQEADALWGRAHGSWKLVLSTGGAKCDSFHPPPSFIPFSFAMISDNNFGNGIGWHEHSIWLSLLHKHHYNARYRRMVVTITDVYIGGRKITESLPRLVRDALNVGKQPEDYDKKPPPTFVIIGASDSALVARGNQSGGLAIWRRLPEDIRRVAYKE